jgi:penicillin G amidase
MTRLRWNVTDVITGETYRTYLVGATVVGTSTITHGRTPIMGWGLTAINPDITDLFVEQIKDDTYLSAENTWTKLKTQIETIKVRFGSDVTLPIRYT